MTNMLHITSRKECPLLDVRLARGAIGGRPATGTNANVRKLCIPTFVAWVQAGENATQTATRSPAVDPSAETESTLETASP